MKKKLMGILFLLTLLIFSSGCDQVPPIENIQQTTSIVGQIGNINKTDTQFLVKAYLEDNRDQMVSSSLADENGYFQVMLLKAGAYVLKIDYTFKGKTFEYSEPYRYYEAKVGTIKVNAGGVTNAGVIYTSLEDIYLEKVLDQLNSIATGVKYSADVEISIGDGIKADLLKGPSADKSFSYMYNVLQSTQVFTYVIKIVND